MVNVQEILFNRNRNAFHEVEDLAIVQFNRLSRGQRIQDDMFRILRNLPGLHLVMFPIEDEHLNAFTVKKERKNFIFINSNFSLDLQIFSAAHELYHVLYDDAFQKTGTELLLDVTSSYNGELTEMKANSFAACLLAPRDVLEAEISLLGIDRSKIKVTDVLKLMDAFALPYEAMVLRLHETSFLRAEQAVALLEFTRKELNLLIKQTHHALRWTQVTRSVEYSNLIELTINNLNSGAIPFTRMERVFAAIGENPGDYLDIQEG